MTKQRLDRLVNATPPAALDQRILEAARLSCAMRRRRRRNLLWSSTAAAAMLLCIGGAALFFDAARLPGSGGEGHPALSGELLAMNDWSRIEQENYNLASELNFRTGEYGE